MGAKENTFGIKISQDTGRWVAMKKKLNEIMNLLLESDDFGTNQQIENLLCKSEKLIDEAIINSIDDVSAYFENKNII